MSPFDLGPALLFCPADRPERFRGALAKADAVILDLEDAVLPDSKAAARGNLIDADVDPDRVIVRVNAPGSEAFASDIATLSQTDFRTVMVAKTESAKSLDVFDGRFSLIALCETARGIHAADRIAAHPRVVAMMWGAEDLVASLGGTSSRHSDGSYRDIARYSRSRVLLESGAQGKAAIDAVHVDLDDVDGLEREAADAAASGFRATACIHPNQVAVIRDAYRPDEAAIAWAGAVLKAAETERGVFRFEGRMIDEPVLRHARSVMSRVR
ncbi:CoA ester lyase [Microbacterium sp. SD291]|uniref:HpcH/HpaI aldolase/citrate lyase family protein n=1 Tax=Microbacterium sp. SD291 TaxID=2782007 RepID=UPI001A979E76|nr:CoA ester lyase [Microbacterium sp. SD291]MBO0978975.1 CoA ester lyase [Microbacterium sp. SD291]